MACEEKVETAYDVKEKLSENHLTCIICTGIYANPQQLRCQHTFCLQCLETWVTSSHYTNQFPCPVCRAPNKINQGKLDVQPNFLVKSLIVFLSSFNTEGVTNSDFPNTISKICQLCEENRPPFSFCKTCSHWLCVPCTRGHAKMKATKSHIVHSLEEFYQHIKSVLNEKNAKVELMNDAVTTSLISLQSAEAKTMEIKHSIQREIDKQYVSLKDAMDKIRADLLKDLDCQTDKILGKIHASSHPLQEIHTHVCQMTSNYKSLITNPSQLSESERQIEQVDDAFTLLTNEFNHMKDKMFNVLNVPVLEYKPIKVCSGIKNHVLGHVVVCQPDLSAPIPLEVGVIRLMHRQVTWNKITGIAVFGDKNYVIASLNSLLPIKEDCLNERNIISNSNRVYNVWGVARLTQNSIVASIMENNIGSGKCCVFKEHNGKFQLSSTMVTNLTSPRDVTVGANGSVVICDQLDACLYLINKDGSLNRIFKKAKDGSDLFIEPMFVTQSHNEDIIVSDNWSIIKILNKDGDIMYTYTSTKPGSEFWGVTTDRNGNILVADLKYGIHILDCKGNLMQLRSDFPSCVSPLAIDRHPTYNSFMIGTASGEIYYMN